MVYHSCNSTITAAPVIFREKSLGSRDNQPLYRVENAWFAACTAISATA
ncbi:MAG: hypothetical protein ACI4JZ_05775 [Oscillospiraceae bacterium]